MRNTIARLLAGICAALTADGATAQVRPAASSAAVCAYSDAGAGTVRTVLDGRTLTLTDGREVRLAAIEVPGAGEAAAQAAKAALEATLGGRMIALKRHGAETDRYGRLVAHVFAPDAAQSAQHALLAAGLARVAPRVGDAACAAPLLDAERNARAAARGIWSDPRYAPRPADDPAAVLTERGRFTLVEGKVVSVRDSGGIVYVNFGRRWSEDFTASTLRRNERGFAAAGLDLRKLGGRTVRVRGVVEERGGPWIEIARPEQIEILHGN